LSIQMGSAHGKNYGENCWPNLMVWVDHFVHHRCRRIVNSSTYDAVDERVKVPSFKTEPDDAIKVFDMVDELLEEKGMTMRKIRKALEAHRRANLKF